MVGDLFMNNIAYSLGFNFILQSRGTVPLSYIAASIFQYNNFRGKKLPDEVYPEILGLEQKIFRNVIF
jgi:hypothetical protein